MPQFLQAEQRNIPHKPVDPRSHKPTDSGVGLSDQEPVRSRGSQECSWGGVDGAIGGGTYTRDGRQPLESIRSESGADNPSRDTVHDLHKDINQDGQETLGSAGAMRATAPGKETGSAENAAMSRDQRASDGALPYWGDLPKQSGGLYNTVTGHGSASDDHAEHHHLPQSGIYNTVTGHGSKGDEASRRLENRSADPGTETTAVEDFVCDPLPDIPEKTVKPREKTKDVTAGTLPETTARHDVLLAANGPTDTSQGRPKVASAAALSPPTQERRAFLLAGSSTEIANSHRVFGSPDEHGVPAAAADPGAGAAAASRAVDKRGKESNDMPSVRQEGRGSQNAGQDTGQPFGGIVAFEHRDHTQGSSGRKTRSHSDASAKSDKHKILGIFRRSRDDGHRGDTSDAEHRRRSASAHEEHSKSDKAVAGSHNRLRKSSKSSATSARKTSPSLAVDRRSDRLGGKEKAAVGAAAGTGVFGILHHRKSSKGQDAENSERNPEWMAGPERIQRQPEPARFDNAQYFSPAAGGPGPAADPLSRIEEVSTPFEHPRAAPMPPHRGTQSTQTAGRGHSTTVAQKPEHSHALKLSGVFPEVNRELSHPPADHNRGQVTQQPGDYNILPSGIPSGVKRDSDTSATKAPTHATDRAAEPEATSDANTTQYNTLPSGTPSGVKPSRHQPRRSSHSHRAGNPSSAPQPPPATSDSTLPTAAAAATATATAPLAAPVPVHPPNTAGAKPNRSTARHLQEGLAAPSPGAYPSPSPSQDMKPPAAVQNMGPGGAPPRADVDGGDGGRDGRPERGREMGPRARPDACRDSVPRRSGAGDGGAVRAGQGHGAWDHHALAGAVGASGSGTERAKGPRKVVYKCVHCGGENDIGEFLRER
ncbi:hypothetical protein VTK26DRAFT_9139 [Humicola hyalothermophila]